MRRFKRVLGRMLFFVLAILVTALPALADSIGVLDSAQDGARFTFDVASLEGSELDLEPASWRVALEGYPPLALLDVRSAETDGVHFIVLVQGNASGSQRRAVDGALKSLIEAMTASDHMSLYRMDAQVETVVEFSSDKTLLLESAASLKKANKDKKSQQALYAGVDAALACGKAHESATDQTVLILFSDGYNNNTADKDATPAASEQAAKEANIRIFTFLLKATDNDPGFMQRMSEHGNGLYLREKNTNAKNADERDTDAKTAMERFLQATRRAVRITGESIDGDYSGAPEDAWRILYTPSGAETLRAGCVLTVSPWATATPVPTAAPVLAEAAIETAVSTATPTQVAPTVTPIHTQGPVATQERAEEPASSIADVIDMPNEQLRLLLLMGGGCLVVIVAVVIIAKRLRRKRNKAFDDKPEPVILKRTAPTEEITPPLNKPIQPPVQDEKPFGERIAPAEHENTMDRYGASADPDTTVDERKPPVDLNSTIDERKPPIDLNATIDERRTFIDPNATIEGRRSVPDPLEQTVRPRANTPHSPAGDTYKQTTLIMILEDDMGERTLQVPLRTGCEVWFGRSADILLNERDNSIGRRHFCILLTPSELILRDDSQNGTSVNGEWLYRQSMPLRVGSKIMLGGMNEKRCSATRIRIARICAVGEQKSGS